MHQHVRTYNPGSNPNKRSEEMSSNALRRVANNQPNQNFELRRLANFRHLELELGVRVSDVPGGF